MASVVVRDSRRSALLIRLFVACCSTVVVSLAGVTAAWAGGGTGGVICPPTGPCTVSVGTPGNPNSQAPIRPVSNGVPGPASNGLCHSGGKSFACNDPVFGWWNATDGCFYKSTTRPSGPTDPINLTVGSYHPPGDGSYYETTCPGVAGTGVGYTWLPSPPLGSPQPVLPAPAVLAQRAVRQLSLAGPDIQTSPPAGTEQVVGLPTWLWTGMTAATWGSHAATAAVPGESVTATATAERIVWNLGDGTTISCGGPGTPYQQGMDPHAASPTCGHTYTDSSAGEPDQAYRVTATTTWSVRWAGAGVQGQLTVRRTSQVALRVAEAQAVNQ